MAEAPTFANTASRTAGRCGEVDRGFFRDHLVSMKLRRSLTAVFCGQLLWIDCALDVDFKQIQPTGRAAAVAGND